MRRSVSAPRRARPPFDPLVRIVRKPTFRYVLDRGEGECRGRQETATAGERSSSLLLVEGIQSVEKDVGNKNGR